ncbi:MAG: exodeoxyribonuclease VII large subunit, partial [Sutterellaceae bacterium]|nr:exodeoxyribonuclease VII large subunit [Sutterellaceae bacterium]
YPRTIGVVTSSEGAAFRDVIKTVRNHAPWVNIILYPTSVQGAQAEGEILAALNAADTRQEVDVLLLVRGGGSLADLWSFNLESVARRIARMTIPVITGVGHETDFTIADFVSDWRAATPTAAAVKAVTLFSQVPSQLQDFERRAHKVVANVLNMAQTRLRQADRMDFAVKTGVRHAQMRVDDVVRRNANAMDFRLQQAKSRFAKADRMDYTVRSMLQQARVRLDAVADIGKIIQNRIDTCQQRVDMSQGALGEAALRGLETRLARLAVLDAQVKKPDFDKDRLAVESLQNTLKRLVSGDVAIRREKLKGLQKRLSGMDVNRVMQRGFSLVTDEKGKLVRDVKNLKSGDALTVRFAKGSAVSRVENVTAE